MSYQYQSFQSSLPPTITSGWNDPPNLSTTTPVSSTRLANMRRRLVDPSIQTGCSGYQGNMDPSSGVESPQQYIQQNALQSGYGTCMLDNGKNSIPTQYEVASSISIGVPTSAPVPSQPTSTGSSLVMTNSSEVLAQPTQGSNHPCQSTQYLPQQQASSGNFYSLPSPAAQDQCVSLVQSEFGNQAVPSAQHEVHRPVYDAFTATSGITKSFDPFTIRPQNSSNPIQTHTAWTAASIPSNPQSLSVGTVASPVLQPIEQNPQNMIFAPPNWIDDARRPFTQQDDTYRPPTKAPGDVSLSGTQLVAFLTKASLRLPQVKCEGVQLRLNQLEELVQQNRISDACLKSLNYVVDSIDSENYEDAWRFFDKMASSFPQEMAAWSQGVRILIGELKKPLRIGSAGSHVRNQ